MNVPWTQLSTSPVIINLDGLYILLGKSSTIKRIGKQEKLETNTNGISGGKRSNSECIHSLISQRLGSE